jgi:Holliday junction resolvase
MKNIGSSVERELKEALSKICFCFRSAASLSVDILAIDKRGHRFLIEVKNIDEKRVVYLSMFANQIQKLLDTAIKCNSTPILAIKFKRKGWSFFNLDEQKNITILPFPEKILSFVDNKHIFFNYLA